MKNNLKPSKQLKYVILTVIILSLPAFLVMSGFGFTAEASGRLKVGIEVLEFTGGTRFLFFDSGFNQLNQSDWYLDLDIPETLDLEVLNPTQAHSETVEWGLKSNLSNLYLTFTSVGYDGDEYINLADHSLRDFVLYTVEKTDGDFEFIDGRNTFRPGVPAPDNAVFLDNFVGEFHRGDFEVKYDPALTDELWCSVQAGEYRDIIEIVVSGDPYTVTPGTQTAWAFNAEYSETFQDLGISNRWGWSNGPLDPSGEYILELWAGAALNDTGRGTYVGKVIVCFDNDEIIYELENDYSLRKVHVYIGNEQIDRNPASGLLGYNSGDIDTKRHVIPFSFFEDPDNVDPTVEFDDPIFIAAHADVSGPGL